VSSNRHLDEAWHYHEGTSHSYHSIRNNSHYLDWANHPLPFKIYSTLEPRRLPREFPQSGVAALSAIGENVRHNQVSSPTLDDLTAILYFSAGITKRRPYPGGEMFFRAAACTGALYEFELYVVCGELADLAAGVYHFGPAETALRQLRAGDHRALLAQATAHEDAIVHAPLTILCAGTYWRNAWKYQSRTYRHFGWDNGTLLANLLAVAAARGLPARVVMAFLDREVNRLLDLDSEREVAFSVVPIGYLADAQFPATPPVEPLCLATTPLSRKEVVYPAMRQMHTASSLETESEVREWREQRTPEEPPVPADGIPLQPLNEENLPRDPIERVILRRGSTRQFAEEPISFAQLSTMLARSTRGFPADFHNPSAALLNQLYLIVNAVDGLQPGSYYFHRAARRLELLKAGNFRREAAYLGLDQELPGAASANVFFLADLKATLDRYGNRGYRSAQLEAGILGGKLYLAAYALGLGASGLTFYDDDVVRFFSPHAAGKSAIFLTCLGRSAWKK